MEDPLARQHALAGGLRQLVTRLSEAELLVMRKWIEEELRALQSPRLRLLREPRGGDDLPDFSGSFAELAGTVRRKLSDLPEPSLMQLHVWVLGRLRGDYGLR